jgi:pantoate--beta-alanine ligase
MNSFGAVIVVRTTEELTYKVSETIRQGQSIGFVPTMGALHGGHVALIKRCIEENPFSICSIFVNPVQFNSPEDLINYPRTEAADIALLNALGCHLVFIPAVEEIYPEVKLLEMDFGETERIMEGQFRPGHFKGVATVVEKLFRLVQPRQAYFGEKDFQQLLIVTRLVRQLKMDIHIVSCATVREADGLAMSSRNIRLTSAERQQASVIYQSLTMASELYRQDRSIDDIRRAVREKIESTGCFRLEYFEVAEIDDSHAGLRLLQQPVRASHVRGFLAVHASAVRLIDNLRFI